MTYLFHLFVICFHFTFDSCNAQMSTSQLIQMMFQQKQLAQTSSTTHLESES